VIPEPASPLYGASGQYELGFLLPLITGIGSVVAAAAPVVAGVQAFGQVFSGGGGGPASPAFTQSECGDGGGGSWAF
jgi:hypothetical protein